MVSISLQICTYLQRRRELWGDTCYEGNSFPHRSCRGGNTQSSIERHKMKQKPLKKQQETQKHNTKRQNNSCKSKRSLSQNMMVYSFYLSVDEIMYHGSIAVEAAGDLPFLVRDGCRIFSFWRTDLRDEVWQLDLWWVSGKDNGDDHANHDDDDDALTNRLASWSSAAGLMMGFRWIFDTDVSDVYNDYRDVGPVMCLRWNIWWHAHGDNVENAKGNS